MNVSKRIPQRVTKAFLGVCKDNGIFFNCTKRKTDVEMTTLWSKEIVEVVVEKCCPGYQNVSASCVPIRSADCQNGVFVGPDKCECNDGYSADKNEYDSNMSGAPSNAQKNRLIIIIIIIEWKIYYILLFACESFFFQFYIQHVCL